MDNVSSKIEEISKMANLDKLGVPEAVIMLGLGLAVLFFGYRIKKVAFFIIWFLLGFNLMLWLMPFLGDVLPDVAKNDLFQKLLPVGGGLLLALLGFSIEKLCIGGICFVLTMLVTIQYFGTDMQTLAIGGIAGVVLAGAAVMLMKPAVILMTAAAGGYALTLAIMKLNPGIDFATFYWPMLLGISAVGAIFQFITDKRMS